MSARIVPDYRALAEQLAPERKRGHIVALANGCFDVLHVGHVRLLAEARAHADLLVVALNTDTSARALKGAGRPYVPLAERMEIVSALAGVDFVTSFGEPTAGALIEALRPEVQIKGTDRTLRARARARAGGALRWPHRDLRRPEDALEHGARQAAMKALRRVALVALSVALALLGARFAGRALMAAHQPDSLADVAGRFPGRTLEVVGHRVHVVEQGAGPALLLVHGFGASTYDFEQHVLAPLAETHRVVAVDLFGMGFSERREDFSYDFAGWADQLAATLDALGIERAVVAGHSMGGAVASILAARHSKQVAGLVLIGALYPSRLSETPWIFLALRMPGLGELGIGSRANLAPRAQRRTTGRGWRRSRASRARGPR